MNYKVVETCTVTDEEIGFMLREGVAAGHIPLAETAIVEMALRLGDRRIGALMTPRTQVEFLDLDDPEEETRRQIRESAYSRFPVLQGGTHQLAGIVQVAQNRPEAGATGKQASRFAGRELHRILFGQIHPSQLGQLHELAFHHVLGEFNQHIEDLEIALSQRHLKRLHVQPVPCQDAAVIAPAGIGRGTPAAGIGAIDYVIVDQCGAVDQFYDGPQTDRASSPIARIPRRKKQQGRTQPLPPALQQITRDLRHRFDGRAILERKLLLDLDQVIANEIENFLRRQK
jgi:hypothetical protein